MKAETKKLKKRGSDGDRGADGKRHKGEDSEGYIRTDNFVWTADETELVLKQQPASSTRRFEIQVNCGLNNQCSNLLYWYFTSREGGNTHMRPSFYPYIFFKHSHLLFHINCREIDCDLIGIHVCLLSLA